LFVKGLMLPEVIPTGLLYFPVPFHVLYPAVKGALGDELLYECMP